MYFLQFFPLGNATGGYPSTEIAIWVIAIGILISTVLSILAFLGIAQSFQVRFLKSQIEVRLRLLESYAASASAAARQYLVDLGAKDPDGIVETANEYFSISPVSIEPIDIIRRLERVLRTQEDRLEKLVEANTSSSDKTRRQIAVTLLAISNALSTIYKQVRHILLLGVKSKSPILIAQLWMVLPLIMRIAKAYHDAIPDIRDGKPIGDSVGPMVAYRLMRTLPLVSPVEKVVKDTVYSVVELDGRKLVVVKAEGPGSTVGKPGEAVEKLAEAYSKDLQAIITVDAAAKLEGEPSGVVAEGAGVAMGDPGPEKIRIERIAVKYGIPIYAVIVKMSIEESIQALRKELVEGVERAVERVKELVKTFVEPGKIAIVVGVGNTIGVAQ
ncbi:MAG: DUF1512 domain-containing protein [Pyrodictiaceae archaeon]